jgi:hypothetical protein
MLVGVPHRLLVCCQIDDVRQTLPCVRSFRWQPVLFCTVLEAAAAAGVPGSQVG